MGLGRFDPPRSRSYPPRRWRGPGCDSARCGAAQQNTPPTPPGTPLLSERVLLCQKCGAERKRHRTDKGWSCKRCGKSSSPVRKLRQAAARRARDCGIPFSLQSGDITIPTHCPVLGIELRPGPNGGHANSPSLDRIRPELGYVSGNVAVISMRANRIKNDATPAELRRVADWLESQLT